MTWETPEITDLGSVADHTFLNSGGQVKPGPLTHTDVFGEASVTETGS